MARLSIFALCGAIAIALLQFCGPEIKGQSGNSSVVDGPVHDGNELTVDLVESQQFENIGSEIDDLGMCVFTSIEMAARAQGLEQMRGWRDWCAKKYSGGGWPAKVDQTLAAWFKEKSLKPIPYYQYQGRDPASVLRIIDAGSRMACSTYGYSPRYRKPISHMICVPRFRGDVAAVLDNNFVGDNNYEWQTAAEFCRRAQLTSGQAWVFVWLTPGQPPAPRNLVKG